MGTLSAPKEAIAPGLAVPAAQPQTEFTITKVVPFLDIAVSTSSLVYNASKPAFVNSSRIGFTNSSGYIIIIILKGKDRNKFNKSQPYKKSCSNGNINKIDTHKIF